MIKYFEFDSIDEYGQHIIPIAPESGLVKTASNSYSPELMKVIMGIKRKPTLYYVVVNALGSYEAWGPNRNGDGFPETGLIHKSFKTDMGSPNDYGYKTFEHYAKLYKHHVNKDPKRSFGEVVHAHWNDKLKRVELVIGIDREKGADLVEAVENMNPVAVSMGCKVRHDECNVCGNKARTKEQYCNHLKNYLRRLITEKMADRWSRETGKKVLPGMIVTAINDFPRFFDISKVHIGADRTSFVLGKAASDSAVIAAVDMAEAYGVTDEMIDKIAVIGKDSDIKKNVDAVINDTNTDALKKAIDAIMLKTMSKEKRLPNKVIDPISTGIPLSQTLSSLLGVGIHPKPEEFQRIVLVNIGQQKLAEYLDDNHMCFDTSENVEPVFLPIGPSNFNDSIGKALVPYLEKRSCYPIFLEKRMNETMEKVAYTNINPDDYWLEGGPETGSLIETSPISDKMKVLGGLAAIYAGLKLKAAGYTPKKIMSMFATKPWLRALIGGGVVAHIISGANEDDWLMRPASEYAGVLQDTNFSGHLVKHASLANAIGLSAAAGAIVLPSAYLINAYNQKSLYEKGQQLFPGAGMAPKSMAITGATGTGLSALAYDAIKKALKRVR